MARMVFGTNQLTEGSWAQETLTSHNLVPGGFKLDAAAFSAGGDGKKRVANGIVVGRTSAERLSGAKFGPAADADDEVFIVAFDVVDLAINDDVTFYRPTRQVYENKLPGWGTLTPAVQGKVRVAYQCLVK